MTTIRVHVDSELPAERFLSAARDFSDRRTEVFPAVRSDHFVVHAEAGTSADVTEGTPAIVGINWERCTYDWSETDRVVATVTESNVYAHPGSVWTLMAIPTDHGSRVDMVWERRFRRSPRGVFWGTMFRLAGRPIFRSYARDIVKNVERLDSAARAAQ